MSLKQFCIRIQDLEAIDKNHCLVLFFFDIFRFQGEGYKLDFVDVNMCAFIASQIVKFPQYSYIEVFVM